MSESLEISGASRSGGCEECLKVVSFPLHPLGCYALNKMRYTDEVRGAYTEKLVQQRASYSDTVPLIEAHLQYEYVGSAQIWMFLWSDHVCDKLMASPPPFAEDYLTSK